MFYLDVTLSAGSSLPLPQEYPECAIYVIEVTVECATELAATSRMFFTRTGVVPRASSNCRLVLFGGAPLDGKRKRDWKDRKFHKVPGDEVEFTPLPE